MNLVASPIVERVGWMLVHSIWLIAIPAALFGLLLWLTPQSYSRLRYAAGIAALAGMALLPFASVAFIDAMAEIVLPTEDGGVSEVQASVDRNLTDVDEADLVERTEPGLAIANELKEAHVDQHQFAPIPAADAAGGAAVVKLDRPEANEQIHASLDGASVAANKENGEPDAFVRLGMFVKPFLPWVVAGWVVGVLLMSFRLLSGWRSTRRLQRRGVQPVPEATETLFAELKHRIGDCQAARLVQSTLVGVPSIVGHVRPLVLLPASALTGLSEEQLRAILAHELAHVKRHDYLVNICQAVVETLLFYHPAVWWVSRCVREEREHCCDDVALRHGCQASDLARALVMVDATPPVRGQELIDSALIPAADGGSLLRRVRRLAGGAADKHVVGRSWISGGIALGLAVVMLLSSVASIAQESGSQASEREVLASKPSIGEPMDKSESASTDQSEDSDAAYSSGAKESDDEHPVDEDPTERTSSATAPQTVPWPDKTWTRSLPLSGSGIRVRLDDRRWVEFNSVYANRKVGDERSQLRWKANGELIDPPVDFDPKSLVPDQNGGEIPGVTRGFLMQVVGPEGIQVALDTSGGGGYGKTDYPVKGSFVQIPLDTIASNIGYNHAYVEVKVSQEVKKLISLDDSRVQFLSDPEARKVFVVTENATDFAWRLMINRDGKAVGVEPFLVGGSTKSWVPEELQSSLKDEFKEAQVLGFSFDKNQPIPELISLAQSPYDTVRFDNLSVYPGPRTGVVVSVNGVPIDDENRPEIAPTGELDLEGSIADPTDDEEFETVTLTGTVVDENGFGINDCWVGLFIQPQEIYGQSTRSPSWAKQPLSAFDDGPPLTLETQTNALGQFTFAAPKTHFVFEGQFWAMRPDGTLGTKWLNAVWSHVQKPDNLKITITDDEATVGVFDPEGKAVVDADVTLRAFRIPHGVTRRLPESVQQRTRAKTNASGQVTFGGMETAAVRGVAVSTNGYGTQFLSHRLASSWVRDNEPLMLRLQSTANLTGRVIDFDPKLDRGLLLELRTEQRDGHPPLYGQAITEVQPDGRFRFHNVVAGRVSMESSLMPESDRKVRFAYVPSLEAGDERHLTAEQNPRMVSGVVVRQRLVKSDTGEGIPNGRLSVLWGDAADGRRSRQSQALTTDADGWWTARVLPGTINTRLGALPDGYRNTAWFDGRNGQGGVKATVPATDKLVTLPPEQYVPAVELTGRLQYADHSPAADWSVTGHPISWADIGLGAVRTQQNGSFTLTYPTGYPPRFFSTSNRQWMTEHDFTDRYVVPEVISRDPLVLQIPEMQTQNDNDSPSDHDGTDSRNSD